MRALSRRRAKTDDARTASPRRHSLIALAALLVAVALAACGSDEKTSADGGSAVSVKADPQQRLLLTHQVSLATERCMHRLGYQYSAPRLNQEPLADIPFAYGNDDVAFARRYPFTAHRVVGGGVVDLAKRQASPESQQDLKRGGTPEWKRALFGTGETVSYPIPGGSQVTTLVGGCSASAAREVFGPNVKRWLVVSNTVAMLDGEVAARVYRMPAYVEALDKWRACVQRAGYVPSGPDSRSLTANPTNRQANVVNATCGHKAAVQATGERLDARVRPDVEREFEAAIIDYNALIAAAQQRLAERR